MESRCEHCIIRELNSLKALKKDELKRISNSKVSKTIKKGEVIFKEGEKLNGVFCVRNGVSKLSKMSNNGRDQIVKVATKGEVLGQRSVITDEFTNLSAVAINDMEVCYIPKKELQDSLNNNINFTKETLLHIASDLKFADNAIVNMAQKNVKQRIAETLIYLEDTFGVDSDGFIALSLSREDISSIVGTAKEACIRMLSSFKKENIISIAGKRIKIEDKQTLNRLTHGF